MNAFVELSLRLLIGTLLFKKMHIQYATGQVGGLFKGIKAVLSHSNIQSLLDENPSPS